MTSHEAGRRAKISLSIPEDSSESKAIPSKGS